MKIGVLCSGGDSPGMNACLRAIVRTAVRHGHEVVGFMDGYEGILRENFYIASMGTPRFVMRSVSGISKRGGTILHSSRCPEFATPQGMEKAANILRKLGIDGLIPIGGNGTLTGAHAFREFWKGKIIGCPGTIDNDLCGTDFTIGFKTSVQTAVDAVDKLRDTASSHHRMFIVELMGRHCGYITLYTALAAGCEIACVPEYPLEIPVIAERLRELHEIGKASIIMVVAEGYHDGVVVMQEKLKNAGCPYPIRAVVLGHLLRGGDPCPEDRILATQTGHLAVCGIEAGETDKMAGVIHNMAVLTPLEEAIAGHRVIPDELRQLLDCVSK
ncbi:MAG: ATP-dependent 6-phosphofructokinase [Planctomycetia bacterium]|nr:ATP-dependent 6-phosphofructokinase [Planctomycetia bacterium]